MASLIPEIQLKLFRILHSEYTTLLLDLLYQFLIMEYGEYSTSCSFFTRVSTLQIIQNLARWVHNFIIRLTLPVIYFGQGWVLHRLFRILQGEYTTWILDLLYQLLIMDNGDYSSDYSESCKVSTQHVY